MQVQEKPIEWILQIKPKDSMFAVLRQYTFADLMNNCRGIASNPDLQLVVEYWGIATNIVNRDKPWPWFRVLAYSTVRLAMAQDAVVGFAKGTDSIIEMRRSRFSYETEMPPGFEDSLQITDTGEEIVAKMLSFKHPLPKILFESLNWNRIDGLSHIPRGTKLNVEIEGSGQEPIFTTQQLNRIHSRLFLDGFRFYSRAHPGGKQVLFGRKYN